MKSKLLIILTMLLCCTAFAGAADKKFTLVIDAGHGGKDPGTRGKTSREKDIALKTALTFGKYVEANCPDVKVIYTRKTDVFVELKERAAIANRNHADLFISIHVNSVESKKPVTGIEVYSQGMRRSDEKLSAAQRENSVILLEKDYKQNYKGYDPNSPESNILFDMMFDKYMENSVEISTFIQKRLSAAGRPGRVKQDNFAVLRLTALPACLVELGYITTPSEEQYMSSSANLDKMAFAIFQAFQDYRKKVGGNNLTSESPTTESLTPAPSRGGEGSNYSQGGDKQEEKVTNQGGNRQEEKVSNQGSNKQEEKVTNQESKKQEEKVTTPLSPARGAGGEASTAEASAAEATTSSPVFKVQLFVGKQKLKKGDKQLKGITDFEYYEEGGYLKYTTGASANYNEISKLRKQLADRFPEAFVIAFKDGRRMDVHKAIEEFNNNKK